MITPDYVRLMAAYGAWQNANLFGAANLLSDAERQADRGAFFKSIHATLDHLLWADQLWLSRLADTQPPAAPDIPSSTRVHGSWTQLESHRRQHDQTVVDWARRVSANELEGELTWYSGAAGMNVTRSRWSLVVQLFNHGTHHRGQVHAMLTAAGAEPGDTDVQFLPESYLDWS